MKFINVTSWAEMDDGYMAPETVSSWENSKVHTHGDMSAHSLGGLDNDGKHGEVSTDSFLCLFMQQCDF